MYSFLFGSSDSSPKKPLYSKEELARKFGEPGDLVLFEEKRILSTNKFGGTSTVLLETLDKRTNDSIAALFPTKHTPSTSDSEEQNKSGAARTEHIDLPELPKFVRKALPSSPNTAETPQAA